MYKRQIWYMFPGLDLHYADPAQPLTTAGAELLVDDLDHYLSDLWRFSIGRRESPASGFLEDLRLHEARKETADFTRLCKKNYSTNSLRSCMSSFAPPLVYHSSLVPFPSILELRHTCSVCTCLFSSIEIETLFCSLFCGHGLDCREMS